MDKICGFAAISTYFHQILVIFRNFQPLFSQTNWIYWINCYQRKKKPQNGRFLTKQSKFSIRHSSHQQIACLKAITTVFYQIYSHSAKKRPRSFPSKTQPVSISWSCRHEIIYLFFPRYYEIKFWLRFLFFSILLKVVSISHGFKILIDFYWLRS